MKTIFFGTPRFAQIVLEKLINSPYKPQLVVTGPDSKIGRGQKLQPSPVKQTAQRHKIATNYQLPTTNYQFDLAILVAYGKIIPKDLLTLPRYGFLNVHPSLLPKYRGPSPIQSAILAGEEKTGVTIMLLDEKIDHGPILAQVEVTIGEKDTHASLIEKLGKAGSDLLIETLPFYINGDLNPQPQNHQEATSTAHVKKSAGFIDLACPPDPQTFDRMIRAFYLWPGVWTRLQTTNYKLQTIKFLPGNLILPEGKRPLTIGEFKNGYPKVYEQIKDLFN